jgi:excisionase family DNA binding protein
MATKAESQSPPDEIMTVGQVANYLHLNKLTIYKYIHEGKLPAIRFGRTFRVRREDVHAFLAAQRFGPKESKRSVRTPPKQSEGRIAQTQRQARDVAQGYVDPRQDDIQPRDSVVFPLDWVIRGLH